MQTELRSAGMELFILAFVVYAIWNMTGGLNLQPGPRAVIAAICIVAEAIIALVAKGVHLH